jgi:hypothetical protein
MMANDIYQYIREKGKTLGIGVSPFSVEGMMVARAKKKNGPDPLQTTLMGRVGGLGNGGGKLLTALAQGRGITQV